VSDENWQALAEASREALSQLGYHVGPECLPGEPDACGGSFAEHTAAHLATLQAVIDHHLTHLQPPPGLVDELHAAALAELARAACCQLMGESGG